MANLSLLKNPKVMVILAIIVIGGGFGVYYQYQSTVSNTVQSSISQTNVSINGVKLLSASQSEMEIQVDYSIENPSSHTAIVEGNNVSVKLVMSNSTEKELGKINIGPLNVEPGNNTFSNNFTVELSSESAFDTLIKELIESENIEITLEGSFNVKVGDLMIPVEATVQASKTVTIRALNGLKDITVNSLVIQSTNNDTLEFELTATVNNPSYIVFNISQMRWDVIYSNEVIGEISANNIEMKHGDNRIVGIGTILSNTTTAQELVSSYISGENVSITLNGTATIGATTGETKIDVQLELPVKLTGQPNIQVSIVKIEFKSFEEDKITVEIELNIYNPSNITGTLKNILLDALYENQKLGTIHVFDIPLQHGNNTIRGEVTFTPTNITALNDLTYKYLTGQPVTITVKGSPTGNTLSSLLQGWEQRITINSPGKLDFKLNNVGLLNSTTNSLFLKFNITFNNPFTAEIKLKNLTLEVHVNGTNEYLGDMTIENLNLKPGENNLTVIAKFEPDNSSLVADLVDKYLSNENITLTLKVSNAGNTLIGKILAGYTFNAVIPGVNPVDIFVISLRILELTNTSILTAVKISITNPTASTVHVENITFQAVYNGGVLGNITLDSLDVAPGTHIYTINVTFTPTNKTLIEELAKNYVKGNQIELFVKGIATGNDVLSQVLARYNTTINVPSLDLNFTVNGFNLINTTNTTLIIGINITLSNQLITSVEVWNVTLQLYYNNIYIGNCTINNTTIQPGTTQYQVIGTLDASANKTNIEEFLSNYIAGKTLTLNISGQFVTNLSGLIDYTVIPLAFTYQLPGLSESLITSVSLYSISIDLTTGTITANTKANIFNPMDFNITILSLQYDIYFNDNDGVDFYFGLVHFYYPPKQNILIDNINENLTNSPIVLESNSTTSISQAININDLELAARLYDEYTLKNRLKVNILNGVMTIQIGSFNVQVEFQFYNVPVT